MAGKILYLEKIKKQHLVFVMYKGTTIINIFKIKGIAMLLHIMYSSLLHGTNKSYITYRLRRYFKEIQQLWTQ